MKIVKDFDLVGMSNKNAKKKSARNGKVFLVCANCRCLAKSELVIVCPTCDLAFTPEVGDRIIVKQEDEGFHSGEPDCDHAHYTIFISCPEKKCSTQIVILRKVDLSNRGVGKSRKERLTKADCGKIKNQASKRQKP